MQSTCANQQLCKKYSVTQTSASVSTRLHRYYFTLCHNKLPMRVIKMYLTTTEKRSNVVSMYCNLKASSWPLQVLLTNDREIALLLHLPLSLLHHLPSLACAGPSSDPVHLLHAHADLTLTKTLVHRCIVWSMYTGLSCLSLITMSCLCRVRP